MIINKHAILLMLFRYLNQIAVTILLCYFWYLNHSNILNLNDYLITSKPTKNLKRERRNIF